MTQPQSQRDEKWEEKWGANLQESLLRFAEGTLTQDERKPLLQQIESSPELARLALAYQRAGTPVRSLHKLDARSLARELKSPRFQNSEAFREAWRLHRSRCEACDRKAQECEAQSSRLTRPGFAVPLRSFATHGLAIAACAAFFVMRTPSPAVVSDGDQSGGTTGNRGIKGEILDPLTAEGTLHNLIKPTPVRLDSTIEAWEAQPEDAEPARSAALAKLYEEQAKATDNPTERVSWTRKSQTARETALKGLKSEFKKMTQKPAPIFSRPFFVAISSSLQKPLRAVLFALLLVSGIVTGHPKAEASPSQRVHQYALLIASGDYPVGSPYHDKPLKGPRNDVHLMASLLCWRFQVSPQEMRVIGANPKEWDGTEQNIPVLSSQATYAAIQRGFEWLKSVARHPADCVVIYYAGHGTRIYNADPNAAEVNSEALVPCDARSDGSNYLRDTQIKLWLEAIASRHKTVIVDACHSGNIIRDILHERSEPSGEEGDGELVSRGLGKTPPLTKGQKHPSQTSVEPPLPAGTVLIAACSKSGQAAERILHGTSPLLPESATGEFTWALYRILCHEQGTIAPYALRQRIADRLEQRHIRQQVPQVLGEMPEEFALGFPLRSNRPFQLPISGIIGGNRFTLEIGWFAGLHEGDVFPLADFPGKTIRVTHLERFRAQIETDAPLDPNRGYVSIERFP